MPRPPRPPFVEAVWTDAIDREGSCTIAEAATGVPLCTQLFKGRVSCGFLAYQDDVRTVLAHNYDPPEADDDGPALFKFEIIPTGWLEKPLRIIEQAYPR